MRLNFEWVERTLAQYPARLVPESDPVVPKLVDMFGDHTFFLDSNGLNIVEPASRLATASRPEGWSSLHIGRMPGRRGSCLIVPAADLVIKLEGIG